MSTEPEIKEALPDLILTVTTLFLIGVITVSWPWWIGVALGAIVAADHARNAKKVDWKNW